MDHDEQYEQNRRTCEASAVRLQLNVFGCEDCGTNLVQDCQPQTPECVEVGFDIEEKNARVVIVCHVSPILGTFIMAPSLVIRVEIALVHDRWRSAFFTLLFL